MFFEVDFNKKNYSYDLGPSQKAIDACKGLGIYKETHNYGYLKRVFSDLNKIISDGNPSNKQACLATRILALHVFPTLDEYQKAFVALSVTSIYENAKYPIPADWLAVQDKYANIIGKDFNQQKAFNAGLACQDLRSEVMIVPPVPEYSN